VFDHLVTFTCAVFEHLAAQDRHLSAAVPDGTALLQLLRQQGHGCTADTQHLSQELLSEWKLQGVDVICAL
jgi:hypothetical protein